MATQVEQIAQRVNLERFIARKSDEYATRARDYAERLAGTQLGKTQVRGLESVAYTTDRISDITDWLKLRVGRDRKREGWAKDGVGRDLLSTLEGLRSDAKTIISELGCFSDSDLERQVHLQLCREFLKHLAAHFEYIEREDD